jgi:hypothetical protein
MRKLTYNNEEGKTSCNSCAGGTYSDAGATVCHTFDYTTISTMPTTVSNLNTSVVDVHGEVDVVKSETIVLNTTVYTLKSDLETEKARTTSLESELQAEKAQNTELNNSILALTSEIQAEKAQNTELNNSILALTTELQAEKTRNVALNITVTKLKGMVQQLVEQYESIHASCKLSDNSTASRRRLGVNCGGSTGSVGFYHPTQSSSSSKLPEMTWILFAFVGALVILVALVCIGTHICNVCCKKKSNKMTSVLPEGSNKAKA